MQETNDTKDLIFIATWAIPAGMVAGLVIELLFRL